MRHIDRRVVVDTFKELQGCFSVFQRVKRKSRLVPRKTPLVGIAGLFLLEMGRISQQQVAELDGGFGADDPALESAADKDRQKTAVVDVAWVRRTVPRFAALNGSSSQFLCLGRFGP